MPKKKLKSLLIVEDDPGLQSQLRWSFDDFDVTIAGDKESAIAAARKTSPTVVTLDLGLPPDPANASIGLETLVEILRINPYIKVIVVTGNGERENALKAIALGAYDYYQKPIDPDVLKLIIDRATRLYDLEEENRRLLLASSGSPLSGIVAESADMLKLCRMVEKVAPTNATTLLLGESGTGKEVIARSLHELSPRKDRRFVAINCAAIPENLLESELFGYERGAFTGAVKQTIGKIENADGGTLFLDEVGDLPLSLQAKLLRFLQERVIERLGGHKEIEVDVRVVCATNQDLETIIMEGMFREDLYYRLSEVVIKIPPLRERGNDAVLIARSILNKYNLEYKRNLKGFAEDAVAAILAYRWPGNIRELENKVKRAVIMEEGGKISAHSLELADGDWQASMDCDLQKAKDQAEIVITQKALNLYAGNLSKAAEAMGISRPTLYTILEKHQIKP